MENEALAKERSAWNAAIAAGPLGAATSPTQIARIVSDLRKENEVLLEKNVRPICVCC